MPPGVLRENALMPHLGWSPRNPRVLVNAGGGTRAGSLILCMLKCLPGARVSGDDTLHASAQHLLENFMRLAAAEPPPYRPLS
jgi:hypothetical protein